MKTKHLIYTLIISTITLGCGSDDLEAILEIPLLAIVNPEQTVAPFTEVTLDGSASTGPAIGFNYEWIYTGSEVISLSSTSEAIVTFTPEKNGFYSFTLRLTTSDGKFSEAFTSVQVTGAVVLDASSFTEDILSLKDIDGSFGGGADYVINADFIIPTGKTLSVENGEDVTIAIAEDAGIIINGTLSINSNSLTLLQASSTSWKGILVDGGVVSGSASQLNIDKAGGSAFDGQEAAAITFINDGRASWSSSMGISNTVSDLGMVLTSTTSASWDISQSSIVINAKVPVKAPIGYLSRLNINTRIFPSGENDYIQLTTSGANITEGSLSGAFLFSNQDYYIDGDFTAGSEISASSCTIFMKEDTGIVGTKMTFSAVTLEGLDGASWKGIASTGFFSISQSTINNAGSGVHNTGSFSTSDFASIYLGSSDQTSIINSNITNSNGHGVYFAINNANGLVQGNTFSGSSLYDATMPFAMAQIIKTSNTWSNDAPVELRASSSGSSVTIPELGNGASYNVTANYIHGSGTLTIEPGAGIKFASNTGLINPNGLILALGTVEKPIIFDGEVDTPGSWNGMELTGAYRFEYCTIKNGGQNAYTGAEKANVVFGSLSNVSVAPQTNAKFDNNTVSNSAGAGTYVKLGKFNPLIDNSTNTLDNNVTQDSDGDGVPDDGEFPGCNNDPGC